jgi:hypothetical protein
VLDEEIANVVYESLRCYSLIQGWSNRCEWDLAPQSVRDDLIEDVRWIKSDRTVGWRELGERQKDVHLHEEETQRMYELLASVVRALL